jgi:hypothetical protein
MPVRRTYVVTTEYSNYWLWLDLGAGYQVSGDYAANIALGIKDWGVRGVFVENQQSAFFLERRFRIL